jgi:hypothetical protein
MTFRSLAVAAALCCAPCAVVIAQQPLSIGTAAGLGDAAVTEARRTDALLWNPALVGVYDGPLSSYTALVVDFDVLPSAAWTRPARALGVDGLPGRAGWPGMRFGGGQTGLAAGAVQWLATQHRDFVLGLSSHHAAAGVVPGPIAQALGGESGLDGPVSPDSTMRSTATVLALARGVHVGRVPLLGGFWLGATAKGWWVHEYARGSFLSDKPGDEVYRETVIHDVPGYGLDLGLLAQPAERIRVGASVTNLVSGAFRPRNGPRVRVASIIPREGGEAEVTETHSPFLGTEDDGTRCGKHSATPRCCASAPRSRATQARSPWRCAPRSARGGWSPSWRPVRTRSRTPAPERCRCGCPTRGEEREARFRRASASACASVAGPWPWFAARAGGEPRTAPRRR